MANISKLRTFKTIDEEGNDIELAVVRPTQDVINDADLIYNVEVSKAVRKGSMTRQEAVSLIEERGLWTEQDEKKATKLRKKVRDLEVKLLDKKTGKKQGRKIADDLANARNEVSVLIGKRDGILNITAESYASAIRDQYFVAMCTVTAEDQESYFDDYEDYLQRSNEVAALRAYQEMLYMINDLDPEFLKNQTENKYLIDNGFMDSDGYLINKDGKRVDSKGRRINDRFEYVLDLDGEEIKCDEFGNPLSSDGSIDIEMLETIKNGKSKTKEPVQESEEEIDEEPF